MITIIDYGMGNLRSVLKIFNRLKKEAVISSKKEDIQNADKLILMGVGHFSEGIKNLEQSQLIPLLREEVLEKKKPILGLCLGMQLFTNHSEEGNIKGLGWIDAETKKFNFSGLTNPLRIPHVGWNLVHLQRECSLFDNIDLAKRYYFTHSYYVKCNHAEDAVATTDYGIHFHSVIRKGNIYGTQFHPEKSHFNGVQLIENFVNKCS